MNNPVFFKKLTPAKIIFGLSTVLTILCFAYFIKGYYYLIVDQEIGAADLYSRWKEQQYYVVCSTSSNPLCFPQSSF